ncbi:MAG: endonuclease/exonuclease/phosphatase family protein [Candidatus Kerfeldbacteria bacterium]|nr:endonuclease/exonuclease/phosphatase family protein [Candidatus Kerfeldbacteria bacterium]
MKIATWNIGSGFISRDQKKFDHQDLNYFIEELRKQNADVICLQEVNTPAEHPKQTQSHDIADALGFSHIAAQVMHPNHLQPGNELSVAVLSRFPVLSTEYVTVPNPGIFATGSNGARWISFDKGFLFCDINMEGKTVRVASGHMLPFHKFKRNFLENEFTHIRTAIAEIIFEHSTLPLVIGADMNFADVHALVPQLFESGFTDLFQTDTTPDYGQCDHLIVSKEWKAQSWQVIPGNADHYLCIAEIQLN